jgi:hypothetical protein
MTCKFCKRRLDYCTCKPYLRLCDFTALSFGKFLFQISAHEVGHLDTPRRAAAFDTAVQALRNVKREALHFLAGRGGRQPHEIVKAGRGALTGDGLWFEAGFLHLNCSLISAANLWISCPAAPCGSVSTTISPCCALSANATR